MAEIIDAGPTFGKFVKTESGEFKPYVSSKLGDFVQEKSGNWQFYDPNSPSRSSSTPPSSSSSGECPPGKVKDPVEGDCVSPAVLRRRQAAREQTQEQVPGVAEAQAQMQAQLAAEAKRERQESAKAIIGDLLASYGLSSLTDYIYTEITKGDITNTSALVQLIRKRPEYAARFPGMAKRASAGFNAISEQEYIDLEQSYRRTLRAAGLPAGFYDDQGDFGDLIGGDVSVAEVGQRIQQGYQAVAQANPQVVNEMRRLYGVDDSGLAAYFLDPARATPILLRQAQAAQIAGQATLQAQQEISAAQAEQLAVAGVTEEQARQGFQTIAQAGELFVSLPGTTEQVVSQEEQIAGVFGTQAAAQQRLRQRQRERAAMFEAGGRFAGQGTTVTGLQ